MNTTFVHKKNFKRFIALTCAITIGLAFFINSYKTASAIFVPVIDVPQAKKELIGDPWASLFAQQILQQITRDTVNWINSGFDGGPGFVTNPLRFAQQVGDFALNEYLTPETLDLLCSPFRANINLALRSAYINEQRFQCTLEDVVGNIEDFYDDFSKGGWQGWFTMTQTTSNLPFGAYFEIQSELDARVQAARETWERKQDWGRGLLAWDECTDPEMVPIYETVETENGVLTQPTGKTRVKTAQECPQGYLESHTPGTIIEGQLEKSFGSGIAKLEAADEINEVLLALANQFISKMLSGGGLRGVKASDIPVENIRPINPYNAGEAIGAGAESYCGSFDEGLLPTASLEISGDAVFTTNRRDVTVEPGDVVTYSWCGANANQYASSYTVRRDLSSGSCADSGTNIPWIAQNASGEQNATVAATQIGCAYEITYAARNTAMTDFLTGNTTTETAESKIIVRVGQTTPPPVAGQCTISEVTPENLIAAAGQIGDEIAGGVFVRGNIINIVSDNGSVDLTPVSPSGVAQSIQQQVASQIGCDETSNLTFVVFQVSNPNALPPEMLTQLGDERPSQILVVIDSVSN